MSTHEKSHGTKDCSVVEELLSPFIDDELNPEADGFVRHHLDSCPRCTAKLDEIKATVDAIAALPNQATPEDDLWPGIVTGAEESEIALPLAARGRQRRKWGNPMLWAAGLAALLIPASLATVGLMRSNSRPAVAPHVTDTGSGHGEFDADELADAIRMATEIASEVAAGAAEAAAHAAEVALKEQEYKRQSGLGAEALMEALQDEDAEIRAMAAHALGELDDSRAVAALSAALLNDPVAEVRKSAAWALGEIESAAGVDALSAALLNDESSEVRKMAAWALGEIESPEAVDVLASVLDSPDTETRRMAVWALGEIESPRAVAALIQLLNDPDNETREMAVWALGEIGSAEATLPLTGVLLNDPAAGLRAKAAWALGEIQDSRAGDALAKAMKDESSEVRRMAIWALGEIGG